MATWASVGRYRGCPWVRRRMGDVLAVDRNHRQWAYFPLDGAGEYMGHNFATLAELAEWWDELPATDRAQWLGDSPRGSIDDAK